LTNGGFVGGFVGKVKDEAGGPEEKGDVEAAVFIDDGLQDELNVVVGVSG
jgi:hypothetical protein